MKAELPRSSKSRRAAIRTTRVDPFQISVETIFDHPKEANLDVKASPPERIPKTVTSRLGPVEWVVEKAAHYVLPYPIFGKRHYHPSTFQVLKVIEGEGQVQIGSHLYGGENGGLFWVPPRVWHSGGESQDRPFHLIEMFFHRTISTPPPLALRQFPFHIPCDNN